MLKIISCKKNLVQYALFTLVASVDWEYNWIMKKIKVVTCNYLFTKTVLISQVNHELSEFQMNVMKKLLFP